MKKDYNQNMNYNYPSKATQAELGASLDLGLELVKMSVCLPLLSPPTVLRLAKAKT